MPASRGNALNGFQGEALIAAVFQRLLPLLAALLLAACGGGAEEARQHAAQIAAGANFRPVILAAGPFHLQAYLRPTALRPPALGPIAPVPLLRVYLEGDGHAWATSDTPSSDPTPWSPIGLELAAADPTPTVAYLARPCQYVPPGTDAACTASVWTGARYGMQVIASTAAALDQLKALTGARRLELVGFSGGAAVAVLVAATRSDIVNLRTVAANLDTALWTRAHGVSPLRGSLDPRGVAARIAALPQRHFVGGSDRNVDVSLARSFAAAAGPAPCLVIDVVAGLQHDGDWAAVWPSLLARPWPPGCP